MSKHVLVLADVRDGKLRNVSLESLAAARTVAEDGTITAAVFGSSGKDLADTLAHHGADKVVTVLNQELDQYTTDAYFQAFKKVVEHVQPDVIFTGHTAVGKDVSPRVAARLGTGLVSDCTNVELAEGKIVFTRPIYAGKAFVKKVVKEGTVFATLRPNNISAGEPDTSRTAVIEELQVDLTSDSLRTLVKNIVKKSTEGVDLSEARIIVSGGRGVKSADGFKPLQELADVLGAAVGASRGACDSGYCDYALQIGQTGKVVTPDLYIACGISGAIQHLAGMSNSKVIVAINKDPEAPIFQVADYGIVGDLFDVVPMLTEEFKKLLADK
ncbi:electron transfer flavoprotein subunit alpha/FixB family protein [Paenactinomyces guangxiensis]|uniref:Electron transfer flavoprotein subunit alpha/FixB family protein n=1 Tax=Paenactinomyces guangxiensis TaxID=1490290 RepID=A0A7W2A968_9BACL|nr:electron transfer flavoprotein subunit alpha/FixB family protein [Paenactinomyces guangxiensis]MBA4494598.1 electron transfer flavoprotein subunit alpha/FixB family protein [Paenactinomyces guangxiensis]MBH8591639.1 electron transfer flavoprotein subunit alpha/FixB family protein [Paenactinomyces guangxiensis]